MQPGGPVRQLYARVDYIPQSETKNLSSDLKQLEALTVTCSGLFLAFDLAEGNNSVRTVTVGPQTAAQLDAAGVDSSETKCMS
jgi:uroporphyrinogen-III synthase